VKLTAQTAENGLQMVKGVVKKGGKRYIRLSSERGLHFTKEGETLPARWKRRRGGPPPNASQRKEKGGVYY